MRILQLRAENVKGVKVVEIAPDGDVVVVGGPNGAGKSSALDAIWLALGGGAASRENPRPVRDGADRAQVTVDLGTMKVTRSWNADGKSHLRVESADGASYRSPQAMLDDLVGRLAFDPLAFAQQSPKEQVATLMQVVDLPFDPADVAAERQRLYDERTEAGRLERQLAGAVDSSPVPPDDLPDAELSVTALADRLMQAEAESRRYADDLAALATMRDRAAWVRDKIAELNLELDALHQRLGELDADVEARSHRQPDLQALRDELAGAETVNEQVRAAATRRRLQDEHRAAGDRVRALTDAIDAIDRRRADAVAAAAMPLPDLGFDDDGVVYRGVPFKQCSHGEQLRVSVAMAMALNPKLRVIRVADGSLLDASSLDVIRELAADLDYQVWVERTMDAPDGVAVYIEDGMVVEAAS